MEAASQSQQPAAASVSKQPAAASSQQPAASSQEPAAKSSWNSPGHPITSKRWGYAHVQRTKLMPYVVCPRLRGRVRDHESLQPRGQDAPQPSRGAPGSQRRRANYFL
eukprot:6516863-Heterocapsa_arctica.AAC.1